MHLTALSRGSNRQLRLWTVNRSGDSGHSHAAGDAERYAY